MENNGNGRGIFYGVIGVATLVVAMVGATFAFFAASETGTAFNATAAEIEMDFAENAYMKTNLIPVESGLTEGVGVDDSGSPVTITDQKTVQTDFDAAAAKALFASNNEIKSGADGCFDGTYNICSMYDFTVTNPSTVEMPINILFTPTNSIANLKYAIFKGKSTEITSWNVIDTVEGKTGANADVGTLAVAARDAGTALAGELDLTLAATDGVADSGADQVSYTILVWIEEVGMKQAATGEFAAQVTVLTGNGQGITGSLSTRG